MLIPGGRTRKRHEYCATDRIDGSRAPTQLPVSVQALMRLKANGDGLRIGDGCDRRVRDAALRLGFVTMWQADR